MPANLDSSDVQVLVGGFLVVACGRVVNKLF